MVAESQAASERGKRIGPYRSAAARQGHQGRTLPRERDDGQFTTRCSQALVRPIRTIRDYFAPSGRSSRAEPSNSLALDVACPTMAAYLVIS